MSYAISIGLNIPVRDSDFGPPDPIECEYDLEGPAFYVTYDDGSSAGHVVCPLDDVVSSYATTTSMTDTYLSNIKDTVKQHGSVAIEHGWRWRLEGGEWMFAHSEGLAEENACEAYMESIEDEANDI